MRVLALDPGYERLGIAIIEKDIKTGKESWVYSETFRTVGTDEFADRLEQIGTHIKSIIDIYKPSMCAIENLFISNNQKTAMRVSEVRGALLFVAREAELEIFEYTPLQIKAAVGGHGKADKKAVMNMTQKLIAIPDLPKGSKRLDDEYDAIACGLTHFAYYRRPR
jgi:crossover junction endodeoxyribonuclease RuvC